MDIIKYTDFNLKKDGLYDSIVQQLSEDAVRNTESESLSRLYDYVHFPMEAGTPEALETIKSIYNDSKNMFEQAKGSELKMTINEAISNNDYSFLLDLIYDVANYKKPPFIRELFIGLLLQNDFYLPDLSKTLSYDSWSYCHEVARFVANNETMQPSFVELLKKQIINNSQSKSAKEKARALVQYNLKKYLPDFDNFLETHK